MKDPVFRSAEFWKSAVMTMPDNSFFELVRSVFGKIKTPFHKQQLASDLEMFLSRDDIQKNIAGYIDDKDARLIAAVAILDEPAPGELESFFSGELSYAELHDMVVNLEERFIFYRFREKDQSRLALNPVLKPVLASVVAGNSSLLFPPVSAADIGETASADGPGKNAPVLNDRMLAALLSFVFQDEPFYKAEGEIRKRIIDAGKSIFPNLELEPLIGGLRVLGLFRAEGEKLQAHSGLFADFGLLEPRERMEYCAAGICCFYEAESPAAISFHLFRGRVRFLAGFMHQFLDSLESEKIYPEKTLKRLADILERKSSAGTANGGIRQKKIDTPAFIKALEKTGLLVRVSADYRKPASLTANAVENGRALIAMDSGFSCLVYPEISYADGVSLASALSVREAGAVFRFELTRESAVRAFDRGFSAAAIIELLRRLSADRIDKNIIWTLTDWEKRYGEVGLRRGLVLSLSPERRYLAETDALSSLIKETLAPGLYLLSENAEPEAVEALQNAGVDIIARRAGPSADRPSAESARKPFPPLAGSAPLPRLPVPVPGPENPPVKSSLPKASTLIAGFRSILEQMSLGRAEKDELAARIDRRLVLCESQLRDASVRYEKLEARGLDYVGKMNIAKQAIAQQAPVELVWPGGDKKGETVFGIPRGMEKEDGETILLVVPAGEKENRRIPLGKISLLRRIKKSIFESI